MMSETIFPQDWGNQFADIAKNAANLASHCVRAGNPGKIFRSLPGRVERAAGSAQPSTRIPLGQVAMENPRPVKLDPFDLRILARLQHDATLPLEELAAQVGLSATPCWRRIRKLEDAGYINRRVALLNRKKLNAGVTVFIAVRTNQHTVEWLESFKNAVRNLPEIVDFYRMSGTVDYLLKAYLPDIESYDLLYQKLISRVQLSDVTSMFAMEEIKSTTEIPLDFCSGGAPAK